MIAKNATVQEHKCCYNRSSSSSAMEVAIVSEKFQKSEDVFQLHYTIFIEDGDRSIHYKILESAMPYARHIKKLNVQII